MDQHSALKRNDPHWTHAEELRGEQDPTQVGRALKAPEVEAIYALSPQAKGRVEAAENPAHLGGRYILGALPIHNDLPYEHMITTVDVNEKQLAEAMRITGAKSKREAIALGLQELIDREKRRRIYALRGSAPDFDAAPRRRRPA